MWKFNTLNVIKSCQIRIISYKNDASKLFFEILCYGKPPSWIYWHSPCESRVHSGSENGYDTHIGKVCLNYLFCTMWCVWFHIVSSIQFSPIDQCCDDLNKKSCFKNSGCDAPNVKSAKTNLFFLKNIVTRIYHILK